MESYIKHCDCLDGLQELADNSIDLICTDPPYGMSFMGKRWDRAVPSVDIWRECVRVLKPGAFAFVMCIPRQDCQAEMIRRLQEAGFNINFTPIYHAFASGFPKAANISKMIDKRAGAENIIGKSDKGCANTSESIHKSKGFAASREKGFDITAPATPEAKHFEGWFGGFQPKPAVELILVCQKPLTEKTYTDQALSNEKGCVNFSACRIPYESKNDIGDPQRFNTGKPMLDPKKGWNNNKMVSNTIVGSGGGRFPANLLVSDNVLDDGRVHSSGDLTGQPRTENKVYNTAGATLGQPRFHKGDSGQFSRFFSLDVWADRVKELPRSAQKTFPFMVVEKASKEEKNAGCEALPEKYCPNSVSGGTEKRLDGKHVGKRKNIHPTAKPLKLMSWLISLGSRQGDIILDPFMGSGTTCLAAKGYMRKYIGFEREKEYFDIAKARIEHEEFLF